MMLAHYCVTLSCVWCLVICHKPISYHDSVCLAPSTTYNYTNVPKLKLNWRLVVVTPVKLLGVTLDQHLTFGTQIANVVSKCQVLLGMLARATPYLPKQLLRHFYTALIRSNLEYCSSLYSSVAKTHIKKLDIYPEKKRIELYTRYPMILTLNHF